MLLRIRTYSSSMQRFPHTESKLNLISAHLFSRTSSVGLKTRELKLQCLVVSMTSLATTHLQRRPTTEILFTSRLDLNLTQRHRGVLRGSTATSKLESIRKTRMMKKMPNRSSQSLKSSATILTKWLRLQNLSFGHKHWQSRIEVLLTSTWISSMRFCLGNAELANLLPSL